MVEHSDRVWNSDPRDGRELTARGPLDNVHIDITHVTSLFGLVRFRIAVMFDVFSRFPLAFAVFVSEPSGTDIVALVEKALGIRSLLHRLVSEDLERDVRLSLLHYAFFQPHAALEGATPRWPRSARSQCVVLSAIFRLPASLSPVRT